MFPRSPLFMTRTATAQTEVLSPPVRRIVVTGTGSRVVTRNVTNPKRRPLKMTKPKKRD